MNGKFVAYYRVSTARQGRSGLGLEAQRRAVADYLNGGRWRMLADFTEIESGKVNDRPKLAHALHQARVTGATLVIAKLDRLSRNAAFLLTLRDSGVEFICADMPDANRLTVGVMALIAEHEREAISKRTKEALQASKRRGKTLGNPNGAAALRRAKKGNKAAVRIIRARADERATNLRPVLEQIQSEGVKTLEGIAEQLNAREMKTARGGRWHKSTVANLLVRLATA